MFRVHSNALTIETQRTNKEWYKNILLLVNVFDIDIGLVIG